MLHYSGHFAKKKKTNFLIGILLFITIAAVSVTIWALFFRQDDAVTLAPDYAPQKEEQNAEAIPGDTGSKLESPEGGGSVSLTYSKDVSIDLGSESASLIFANPGKSTQNMVLQIVIQDTVIVQSGTLLPGNQVTTLNLLDGMSSRLRSGVYEGKFHVFYYDPETGEKAIVNTEIPVSITVK